MDLIPGTVDLSQQTLQIDRAACTGTGNDELHGELPVASCPLSVASSQSPIQARNDVVLMICWFGVAAFFLHLLARYAAIEISAS
jgi:hypothetical protein